MTRHDGLRLLVVDAYDRAGRDALDECGVPRGGEVYRRLLHSLAPGATVDVASCANAELLQGVDALTSYHGVVWSGSSLSVYEDNPVISKQVELVRATMSAGIPAFGSCYAAQLAAVACGGAVEANPRGREFGVGRKISLTPSGQEHPLYRDKGPVFDALTCHSDHITALPQGAELLATNAFSFVQALAIETPRGASFWAVQYHPEFDPETMAGLARLRAESLIGQGLFKGHEQVERYAHDMEALQSSPEDTALSFAYGVDHDVLDQARRSREVLNWIEHKAWSRL